MKFSLTFLRMPKFGAFERKNPKKISIWGRDTTNRLVRHHIFDQATGWWATPPQLRYIVAFFKSASLGFLILPSAI